MAEARCFRLHVDGESVTLHDLGAYVGKDVTVFVVENEGPATRAPQARGRLDLPFGVDRGKIEIADDFDSLPDDIQAAFEGKSP